MLKKEISEVKKCFTKKHSCIDHAVGCYVDIDGKTIADIDLRWFSLSEEDSDMYESLMRKAFSGKQGKNLYDVAFPNEEEKAGGTQAVLYAMLQDQFENKELIRNFFAHIAESISMDSPYLILLSGGVYDVPKKASDGATLEDESQDIYRFMQCIICPVKASKNMLTYDEENKTFTMAKTSYSLDAPVTGFLFPAFNDRCTDIHNLLFYTKKEEERHEDLLKCISGCDTLPDAETTQKTKLAMVIENTLGKDCDFTNVKNITETLDREAEESSDQDEDQIISKNDLSRVFRESGINTEKAEAITDNYDKIVGEAELKSRNVKNGGTVKLESQSMKATIDKEYAFRLETKVIDGREFILLPVENDMALNGVHVTSALGQESR